ncbi:hypothetical protein C8R43DRAFT_1120974 [Mycena crocata]|nr:hypothetical protein C8R43DRAFT_1120974 [Mycena crocata]
MASPEETSVDIRSDILKLTLLAEHARPILAPPHVAQWLSEFCTSLGKNAPAPSEENVLLRLSSSPSPADDFVENGPIPGVLPSSVKHEVKITRKTTLSALYTYEDFTVCLEYPESSPSGVGYLMRRDPSNWTNPLHDFAYSVGPPGGQNQQGEEEECPLLKDPLDPDKKILCLKIHRTCQGVKICPQANTIAMAIPHSKPSRKLIRESLARDIETHAASISPTRVIFDKTAALITALRSNGCGSSDCSQTPIIPLSEQSSHTFLVERQTQIQRGYEAENCKGRIFLDYNSKGKPVVTCEFYSIDDRQHLRKYVDESYDLEYMEAFFHEDQEELDRIEEAASLCGYGPLADCTHVANFSLQRFHCPRDHRDLKNQQLLLQLPMERMKCQVRFQLYEPLEEFRAACPYVLVVCAGEHPHPIPIPSKTPPKIRSQVMKLLQSLHTDLADLTPRRFLRHPVLRAFLGEKFPHIPWPILSDLHCSLANRAHLKTYITAAKVDLFPAGTGWKGVQRLKQWQDAHLPPEDHYIRYMSEIPDFPTDAFDDEESPNVPSGSKTDKNLRVIICMSPKGSRRLRATQYLQSDIAFKRIQGYLEFEIASMDLYANTSVIFLRIYLNRQTAAAHEFIMGLINDIVKKDTGFSICWRHLHADSVNDTSPGMVLMWTADSHGGQAKGIGLHLQKRAQEDPTRMDLHDPTRTLASLTPYEHLHRLFRFCSVHGYRNIKDTKVDEQVKIFMRSLICIRHASWDHTLASIQQLGGKPAVDWVQNKIRSKFVFEAMCWEKSHIPEDVWKAGPSHSNLVEGVHADVNQEGRYCTLLGGLDKGHHFDTVKMRTLDALEDFNIRPSYSSGHISVNATKNLKRKIKNDHKGMEQNDTKIAQHNAAMDKYCELWRHEFAIYEQLLTCLDLVNPQTELQLYETRFNDARNASARVFEAQALYLAQSASGTYLKGTGSGKIRVCTAD